MIEQRRHIPYVIKQTGSHEWTAYHAETGFVQGRNYHSETELRERMDCMTEPCPKLFEILPSGDPYSKAAWVREYEQSFNDRFAIFRGDLPELSRTAMERYLRREFPGCKIRRSKG